MEPVSFHDTGPSILDYQSIPQRFEQVVHQYPQNVAVKSLTKEFTYDVLNKAANQLAHAITKGFGTDSEPIALLFGHDVEQFIGIFGVLKSGKFYVPLDPAASHTRNAGIIEDTQTRLILTDDEHMDMAVGLSSDIVAVLNINQVADEREDNLALPISQMALAYVIYTSGSSGKPKGVLGRHREMLHYTLTKSAIAVTSQDRVLMLSRYFFSGSLGQIFRTLTHGGAAYPFDVQIHGLKGLVQWIKDNRITIYESVPPLFRQMVNILEPHEVLDSVRIVGTGGEGVLWTDFALYKQHFNSGCLMGNGYGLTEVKIVTRYVLSQDSEMGTGNMPVGYPVPDVEVLIRNEQGEKLGPNEVGEIAVVTRYMTPGYWRSPELNAQKFLDIPGESDIRMFLTGDIGMLLQDGCLVHLGRKDSQVKIRGHRVELGEIEAALLEIDTILETAVVGRLDRYGQLQLVAYIVTQQLSRPKVSDLRRVLQEKLPQYMLPAIYVCIDKLPQTATGKTDRMALPEPNWERPHMDNAYVAPRNALERHITSLCEDVLGINQIGLYDNFFELGGDSIKLFQLLNRLQPYDGYETLMKVLFEKSTIADLVTCIEDSVGNWI